MQLFGMFLLLNWLVHIFCTALQRMFRTLIWLSNVIAFINNGSTMMASVRFGCTVIASFDGFCCCGSQLRFWFAGWLYTWSFSFSVFPAWHLFTIGNMFSFWFRWFWHVICLNSTVGFHIRRLFWCFCSWFGFWKRRFLSFAESASSLCCRDFFTWFGHTLTGSSFSP